MIRDELETAAIESLIIEVAQLRRELDLLREITKGQNEIILMLSQHVYPGSKDEEAS